VASIAQQLHKLELEMRRVMEQTFERPPTTLDGFARAVGRYHGLRDAAAHLTKLEQEGNEK
jgi:hypothetical protein